MPFQKGNELWKRWKSPPFLGRQHTVETRQKIAKNGKHQFQKGSRTLGFTGHQHSLESRQKISRPGKSNGFYGKHHSEEFKQELAKRMSILSKKRWSDAGFRQRAIAAIFAGRSIRPNRPESKLIALIKQAQLPFKYTGDGSVIIHGFVPDFVESNGHKLIIELFGEYWHDKTDMRGKAGAYNHYGYDTLFIWVNELKDGQAVISKIKTWEMSHAS